MINSTKTRLEGAKVRYNDLKDEVDRMKIDELKKRKKDETRKKKEENTKIVVEEERVVSIDSDECESSTEEEEEEEDYDDSGSDSSGIERQFEIKNGSIHSTSSISRMTATDNSFIE